MHPEIHSTPTQWAPSLREGLEWWWLPVGEVLSLNQHSKPRDPASCCAIHQPKPDPKGSKYVNDTYFGT